MSWSPPPQPSYSQGSAVHRDLLITEIVHGTEDWAEWGGGDSNTFKSFRDAATLQHFPDGSRTSKTTLQFEQV